MLYFIKSCIFQLCTGWFRNSFALEQWVLLLREAWSILVLGNRILLSNSWDLHREDCLGCDIRERSVEKPLGKGLRPAVPLSSLRWGPALPCYQHRSWEQVRQPSWSCEQLSCWSDAIIAYSSSDYFPLRMQSRSSSSPVDMQLILPKHTGVDCHQHLSNDPNAFDTGCLLATRRYMLSTSGMARPWLEVWTTAFGRRLVSSLWLHSGVCWQRPHNSVTLFAIVHLTVYKLSFA